MGEIEFRDVRKVYGGDITAVEQFNLTVEDGEFLTIVGPSGSGKSTLMRMVAGLESITNGEIRIDGRVINGVSPQNRDVAMIFQNYALYPHMTARRNMSIGLEMSTDLSKDEINQRVQETGEMLDIKDQLDKKPGNLSGGQQQRVATGRAIVREPEVFLMDEPLSNLDAKLRVHMRTELQQLQQDLNTTTIYVTHDQEEAMTMSDRIVILANGELQQVGNPEEVYEQPANLFVADFIGSPSMNFFNVKLEDDTLVGSSFEYKLSESLLSRLKNLSTSDDLILGVRPENIKIAGPETGEQSTISAIVDVREPVGSDNYLYVSIGDEDLTMRVPGDQKIEQGTTIDIAIREEDIHLFDSDTEENVLLEKPSGTKSETVAP